jgi:hypothetical protein
VSECLCKELPWELPGRTEQALLVKVDVIDKLLEVFHGDNEEYVAW